MGTERSRAVDTICKCGQGAVFVNFCTPTHGYPTSTPIWYEYGINCEICSSEYYLMEQCNQIIYVSFEEKRKREKIWQEALDLESKLLNSPVVTQVKKVIDSMLTVQASKAAIHRLLSKHNFCNDSLQTFRKYWQGKNEWLNNIRINSLDKAFAMAGYDVSVVEYEVQRVQAVREKSYTSFPTMGNVVYKMR